MRRLKMWQMILAVLGIILLIGVTIIGLGSLKFRNDFNAIALEAISHNTPDKKIVTEADLVDLPEPVQRYLRYTGVIGKETINTVRLKQTGVLRQTPEDTWKNIEAIEYFSVNPPEFVWMGQMAVGPLNIISARDSYLDEHGHMRIQMLGIHTIGDVQGEEMDYSSLVRYLNEMMWFPTAFLNDNISWEAVDGNSAKVTITEGNTSASAVLYFDEKGALTNFVGERYREVNGVFVKDTWETPMTGYGEFNGLKLPVKGVAVWKMSSGDFSYFEMEITSLEYNVTEIYK
ncbi:MAG: hypothetical protein NTV61_09855 [Candidatus Bathyarchaeota archaeon]|nr:hypothetical protein [Candidatus Bathyarchaeota archaeon]